MFNARKHLRHRRLVPDCAMQPRSLAGTIHPSHAGEVDGWVIVSSRCFALHQGVCLISQRAPVSHLARGLIRLTRITKEKMLAGRRRVAASAVISPAGLRGPRSNTGDRVRANVTSAVGKTKLGPSACCFADCLLRLYAGKATNHRLTAPQARLCCAEELYQKLLQSKGYPAGQRSKVRCYGLMVASVSAEWLTCMMNRVRVGLITEEQEWWNKKKLYQHSGPNCKGGISTRSPLLEWTEMAHGCILFKICIVYDMSPPLFHIKMAESQLID